MVCCLNLSKMNFEIRQTENDLRNWAWCRRPRPRNYCCCCCWLMSCQVGPNSGSAKGRGMLGQFELRFVISPVKEKFAKISLSNYQCTYYFFQKKVVMPIHKTTTYKHEINPYSNHSRQTLLHEMINNYSV